MTNIWKLAHKRTFSDYLILWVDTNARNMSTEKFKEYTGSDFFEFEKKNNKETRQAWCDYGGFKNPDTYNKEPKCICEEEEKLAPTTVA